MHSTMVKDHPESYSKQADFQIDAVRLRDQIISPARTILLVLLASSGAGLRDCVFECRKPDSGPFCPARRANSRCAPRWVRVARHFDERCLPKVCCFAAPARFWRSSSRGRWLRCWRDMLRAFRCAPWT